MRLVIQSLDSCAMADELVRASRSLSGSVVPEPLVLSCGNGTEPLALSSSLFSSSSMVTTSSPLFSADSSSRSPHFCSVPTGFSWRMENGDRLLELEPEPLALSRAEMPPRELEPLSLSLSEESRSMRSLMGVCSLRTCC